jgi:hypothetical protein
MEPDHLKTLMSQISRCTLQKQKLDAQLRQALKLLERAMFFIHMEDIRNDYDEFLEEIGDDFQMS